MKQREIKFRAWDAKKKEMFYDEFFIDVEGDVYWNETQNLADVQLMQFTGFLDKNKKEVWEGDIIDCVGDKVEVIFHQGCFVHKIPHIEEESYHNFDNEKCEVIGNVWENPELLKA